MLREIFSEDDQKKYYITIDRLDEHWVSDDVLRYQLIRALLEAMNEFNRIPNVKIIMALREDLADRVFIHTRGPDYQEEKYKSMYLKLTWTDDCLAEVLERRVNQLIKNQYTNQSVKLADVLQPELSIAGQRVNTRDYLLDRTMRTPREVIALFNDCIEAAEGKPKISHDEIMAAEGVYSENRLRYLADEWSSDYPNLIDATRFLKKRPKHFKIEDIKTEPFDDFVVDFIATEKRKEDAIYVALHAYYAAESSRQRLNELLRRLLTIFYRVGIVGVKSESYSAVQWVNRGNKL